MAKPSLLVCFLALVPWRSLERWMCEGGMQTCGRRLVEEIAAFKSMEVVLSVRWGDKAA